MLTDLFVSSIPPRVQIVAVISSVVLLAVVVYLIRRQKLKEGYSIVWFLVGLTLVLFSIVTRLLDRLADLVGIGYSPSAFFLIIAGGLFVLALHFSVLLSKHDRQIRSLARENALLRVQLEEKGKRMALGVRADVVTTAREPSRAREHER